MKNLLAGISISEVKKDPFPYIVAENVLPQDIYDRLASSYPSMDVITKGEDKGSNKRFDYTIKDIRSGEWKNPLWSEFLEVNASKDFFADFVRLFGDEIDKRYPFIKSKFGSILSMKHGIRYIDTLEDKDILFDAHISLNTPVITKPTSVRAAHVDGPRKLFGGLFYMRPSYDTSSEGGELLIYKYKDKNKKLFHGQGIDEKYVEVVSKIPYKANTLVIFLNTIDSVHGVTTRQLTPHPRLFVNLVAEVKENLLDIDSIQESLLKRRLRIIKAKLFS